MRLVLTFLQQSWEVDVGAPAMPTTKECRHNAQLCLMLASETTEIYAKTASIELAKDFRALAEDLERRHCQ
jgi:hypothetical protein